MSVAAVERHELLVRAVLHDAAFVEHDDLVGIAHRREPVRDQDRDPVGVSERKCSKICASVSASMAAVGSSSTRISAPVRMNARASAMRCHWPPDSSWPLLNQRPSCVS